jgi:hypothetical protein
MNEFIEHPILMSGPMVCATMRATNPKTNTRRICLPQWPIDAVVKEHSAVPGLWLPYTSDGRVMNSHQANRKDHCDMFCPYGQPGDRLWMRETWKTHKLYDPYAPSQIDSGAAVYWLADDTKKLNGPEDWGKTRTSIHMPRWASRLTLEVLTVRVERLQDISEDDAKAEGLVRLAGHPNAYQCAVSKKFHVQAEHNEFCGCLVGQTLKLRPAVCAFGSTWNGVNAKRGHNWDSNPWVWAIEFKRLSTEGKQ